MKKLIDIRASTFADPQDVARFRRAKARGLSDTEAFRVGDNGIGCWGDDTTGAQPMIALPPETLEEWYGAVNAGRFRKVRIDYNGLHVLAIVGDRMPHLRNIKNGCRLDMNPALCALLRIKPPAIVTLTAVAID